MLWDHRYGCLLTLWVESKKLSHQFIGPFAIHGIVNSVSVHLKLLHNMRIHNVSQIKLVLSSCCAALLFSSPLPLVTVIEFFLICVKWQIEVKKSPSRPFLFWLLDLFKITLQGGGKYFGGLQLLRNGEVKIIFIFNA